jgi:glycine cleavage system transcriptional repressor
MDELGGDLQEVSQTVVQKFFTLILAAEFPDHRELQVIVDHIRDVCRPYGIEVCLKDPLQEQLPEAPADGAETYFAMITGYDKPGIMREISARLAQEQIDVTDLYALRNKADCCFVLMMELAVPPEVDPLSLQKDLEDLGRTIDLSATLTHETEFDVARDLRPTRVTAVRHLQQFVSKPELR